MGSATAFAYTILSIILIIWLFYTVVPTILLSFLQWYLCGKNLRWGKVLPIISAAFSVLAALLLVSIGPYVTGGGWRSFLLCVPVVLILFNLPTLVYYLVYRARKKRNEQNDLNRMKIDDLE